MIPSELQSLHSYPSPLSNADLPMTHTAQHCQAEQRSATRTKRHLRGFRRHSTICLSFNFQTGGRVSHFQGVRRQDLSLRSLPTSTSHLERSVWAGNSHPVACGFTTGTVSSGAAPSLRARGRHGNHGLGSVRPHRSDRDSLAGRNSHHSSKTRTG